MLGIALVLDVETGDALLDVAPREVIGVGHRLAERIGVRDQRDVDGIGDAAGLLDLLDLAVYAVIGHRVVERAAGMAAEIDGREADIFADAAGDRRKAVAADEMLAF